MSGQVRVSLSAVIVALAFGLGACSPALPSIAQGPTAPCAVTVSQQAANQFLARVSSQTQLKGKAVTITASNQEITSLLVQALAQAQQTGNGPIVPIQNPIVCFGPGKMSLFGTIKPNADTGFNVLLTLDASVGNGQAVFRVEQAEVGPFSMPQDLGNAISTLLGIALNQSLGSIQLVQITFEQGQMRLTGQVP